MGNWAHHLWFTYVYPSLLGNGPEDVFRTTVALILAYVFIPQVRRFIERGWDRIHTRFDGLHDSHKDLHKKLDHIIKHHPDIPEIGSNGHTKKEQE